MRTPEQRAKIRRDLDIAHVELETAQIEAARWGAKAAQFAKRIEIFEGWLAEGEVSGSTPGQGYDMTHDNHR